MRSHPSCHSPTRLAHQAMKPRAKPCPVPLGLLSVPLWSPTICTKSGTSWQASHHPMPPEGWRWGAAWVGLGVAPGRMQVPQIGHPRLWSPRKQPFMLPTCCPSLLRASCQGQRAEVGPQWPPRTQLSFSRGQMDHFISQNSFLGTLPIPGAIKEDFRPRTFTSFFICVSVY